MDANEFLELHGIPNLPTQLCTEEQTEVKDTVGVLEAFLNYKTQANGVTDTPDPSVLGSVMASFLKAYDTDILQIEIDRENNVIKVAKCTESNDFYVDYDYEYMEDIKLP